MIGEHGHPWVLADVAQPLQGLARLRLLINGRVDGVTVNREGGHHHVRTPLTISGSQPRHGHGGEPGPRLFFGKPHGEDSTGFVLLAGPAMAPTSGRIVASPAGRHAALAQSVRATHSLCVGHRFDSDRRLHSKYRRYQAFSSGFLPVLIFDRPSRRLKCPRRCPRQAEQPATDWHPLGVTAQSGIPSVRMPCLGVGVQPLRSLLFLDALEENPPIASTVWRADPSSKGIAPETCLVRQPLP